MTKESTPAYLSGRARRGELEMLRAEVRELRYLSKAVLMFLVGKDSAREWEIEARVQDHGDRERHSRPIAGVAISGDLLRELSGRFDVWTLLDLVREFTREEVAAMPGVGAARLQKMDEALAAEGREWADAEEVAA